MSKTDPKVTDVAPTKPTTEPAPQPAPKTTMVTAKLRALDHRGNTVHTRWGNVTFDKDGLAELEVPEDELPMLSAMQPHSWLAEDHTSYQLALEDAKKQKTKAPPAKPPEGTKGVDGKFDTEGDSKKTGEK